jgi:HemX protein
VSAIHGLLFLLLYHQLKSHRFGLIWRRLPSLELLASMSLRAAVLGLVFLTVTIVIGVLWATQRFPGFYGDSKFIMTLLVWFVYGIGIALHYWLGWSGRQTIFLSLVGFVLMVISMAVRLWLPSFHGFA